MSAYEIIPSIDESYMCIIIPTSHYEPLKEIDKLVQLMNDTFEKPGYVIFDFVLSVGNSGERFAKVFFNNDGFVTETFQYVKVEKNDMIRELVSDFLRSKNFYLTHSVLNSVQKNMIKNGYPF